MYLFRTILNSEKKRQPRTVFKLHLKRERKKKNRKKIKSRLSLWHLHFLPFIITHLFSIATCNISILHNRIYSYTRLRSSSVPKRSGSTWSNPLTDMLAS